MHQLLHYVYQNLGLPPPYVKAVTKEPINKLRKKNCRSLLNSGFSDEFLSSYQRLNYGEIALPFFSVNEDMGGNSTCRLGH